MSKKLPAALLKRIAEVKSKRPKTVLDRIVANGSISTDELKEIGYNHAPRAARDVREIGIQLKTTMVKNSSGGRMASYSFADRPLEKGKTGREQFPKKLRDRLIEDAGGCCQICGADHNLQVDHKIPYAVGGEVDTTDQDPFQILCGSCNRTKSWACEHCSNIIAKNPNACRSCYWANQSDYEHVATRAERRIDLVWIGGEIAAFERLQERARQTGKTAAKELKDLLNQANNAP